IPDGSTKVIVQANSLVLQAEKNPYVAQRNAEAIKTPEGSDRLFEYQAAILRRSRSAIELQCQKFSGFESKASKHSDKAAETASPPDHADVRFAPGLVAVAVALYKLQGRQRAIRAELARAAAHWQRRPGDASISLLHEAGLELLRSSDPNDLAAAGVTYTRLS